MSVLREHLKCLCVNTIESYRTYGASLRAASHARLIIATFHERFLRCCFIFNKSNIYNLNCHRECYKAGVCNRVNLGGIIFWKQNVSILYILSHCFNGKSVDICKKKKWIRFTYMWGKEYVHIMLIQAFLWLFCYSIITLAIEIFPNCSSASLSLYFFNLSPNISLMTHLFYTYVCLIVIIFNNILTMSK